MVTANKTAGILNRQNETSCTKHCIQNKYLERYFETSRSDFSNSSDPAVEFEIRRQVVPGFWIVCFVFLPALKTHTFLQRKQAVCCMLKLFVVKQKLNRTILFHNRRRVN